MIQVRVCGVQRNADTDGIFCLFFSAKFLSFFGTCKYFVEGEKEIVRGGGG